MLQQILSVLVVLGLLGGLLWLLRSRGLVRYGGSVRRKSGRHIEAIARLPLTAQHSVHLIRVLDHAVLLTLSPSGCTLVERLEWTPALEPEQSQRIPGATS